MIRQGLDVWPAECQVRVYIPGNNRLVILYFELHPQALVKVLAQGVGCTDVGMHGDLFTRWVEVGNDLTDKSASKAFALV